jgi:hypothetical protein
MEMDGWDVYWFTLEFEGGDDRGSGHNQNGRRNRRGGRSSFHFTVITIVTGRTPAIEALTIGRVATRAAVLTGHSVGTETHASSDTEETIEGFGNGLNLTEVSSEAARARTLEEFAARFNEARSTVKTRVG